MTDQPSRLNPANGLTLLRLVLVPVFAWILLSHPHDLWWRLGSTALFGLAIATDALDGRIARKYNLITDFGKLWDSIADKALTGMAFIGLSILGELPWWITVPVFLIICGSLFVNLVQYQVSIASKQQELQSVQNQLSAQLTENAELSGTLEQGDSAIIERYAREQGYAKPNERVFVDISGK